MIIIRSNYNDIDREFDRLDSMPDTKMDLLLDGVLGVGFTTAKGNVHVETGRLKASGKMQSKSFKNTWRGSFTFGAPSAGVDYAIYEKARGGSHDFFNQVYILKAMFKAAILKGLRKK